MFKFEAGQTVVNGYGDEQTILVDDYWFDGQSCLLTLRKGLEKEGGGKWSDMTYVYYQDGRPYGNETHGRTSLVRPIWADLEVDDPVMVCFEMEEAEEFCAHWAGFINGNLTVWLGGRTSHTTSLRTTVMSVRKAD